MKATNSAQKNNTDKKLINVRPIPDRKPRTFEIAEVKDSDEYSVGHEISEKEIENLMISPDWRVKVSVN